MRRSLALAAAGLATLGASALAWDALARRHDGPLGGGGAAPAPRVAPADGAAPGVAAANVPSPQPLLVADSPRATRTLDVRLLRLADGTPFGSCTAVCDGRLGRWVEPSVLRFEDVSVCVGSLLVREHAFTAERGGRSPWLVECWLPDPLPPEGEPVVLAIDTGWTVVCDVVDTEGMPVDRPPGVARWADRGGAAATLVPDRLAFPRLVYRDLRPPDGAAPEFEVRVPGGTPDSRRVVLDPPVRTIELPPFVVERPSSVPRPFVRATRGAIAGRVVDERGTPVPRVTVEASRLAVPPVTDATSRAGRAVRGAGRTDVAWRDWDPPRSDVGGAFEIASLMPGTYRLVVSGERARFDPTTGPLADRRWQPDRLAVLEPVVVAEDETTEVELRLPRLGAVAGRTVDPDGVPLENVPVQLLRLVADDRPWSMSREVVPDAGEHQVGVLLDETRSGAGGAWAFADVGPGRLHVRAAESGGTPFWPARATLELLPGRDVAGVELVPPGFLALRLRLVTPSGEPWLGTCRVRLDMVGTGWRLLDRDERSGPELVFGDLRRGAYVVELEAGGTLWSVLLEAGAPEREVVLDAAVSVR